MVSFMNKNKYKIIFLDIDDTLNVTNGEVSEYAKKVLKNHNHLRGSSCAETQNFVWVFSRART